MSERTMNSDGFNIVGSSSSLRCVEVPQEAVAPASVNSGAKLGHPLSVSRVKGDTLVSRRIIGALAAICAVLGYGCDSEVGLSVVKGVSGGNVVNLDSRAGLHNLAVHCDSSRSTGSDHAYSVVGTGVFAPMGKPVPLHEPVVVMGVNDRVESFGKRNEFYGFIRRLLDSMTFNRNFHSAIVAL